MIHIMIRKKTSYNYLIAKLSVLLILTFFYFKSYNQTQTDTIKAPRATIKPIIDGKANDVCWSNPVWHSIDQVWIPFGATMKEGDFSGKFTVTWDSLYLYVLTQITDDSLSDDHFNPLDLWWDDDCVEIFIDENRSGGIHQFNNNAFAYHVSLFYDAVDLDANGQGINYKDHVQTVMLKLGPHLYQWEFAIKIYDETFTVNNPEASRVKLYNQKLMGFSIAYCDNDETTSRENFIGSIKMTPETANDNFITADYFGTLLLVDPEINMNLKLKAKKEPIWVHANPATKKITVVINQSGFDELQILNIIGQVVKSQSLNAQRRVMVDVSDLNAGIYFLEFHKNDKTIVTKKTVVR